MIYRVVCICGRPLDDARVEGTWTIGDTVCEYRTCVCGSTRAWSPRDVVTGRLVAIYEERDSSAVAWEGESFLDALDQTPADWAEIRRNGVLLARSVTAPDGRTRFWRVMPPERETDR